MSTEQWETLVKEYRQNGEYPKFHVVCTFLNSQWRHGGNYMLLFSQEQVRQYLNTWFSQILTIQQTEHRTNTRDEVGL